ncbi:MAG: cytidine deaminase [Cytophagaceae bacterium]|nr:cytidine deaminase [Cytophagaceae bacterium]
MQQIRLEVPLDLYDTENDLPEPEQKLLTEARQATFSSYAPYSGFHVGAAVLLDDDTIVTASNQENAAFPSGSCAEQSLVFWVGANHPGKQMLAIAVVARPGESNQFCAVSPCGACRQALLEYENRQAQPIRLLMLGTTAGQVLVSPSVAGLLPVKFDSFD